MMSGYWLFRFTSYSYCQGTRDAYRDDMRLLKFTLPCDIKEARICLITRLQTEDIEFDKNSIECITSLITNS
jgi:hypothetical protein